MPAPITYRATTTSRMWSCDMFALCRHHFDETQRSSSHADYPILSENIG